MPAQQAHSSFASKMGNRLDAAIKAHAGDETDYGFQRLPPGINGVAQLTKCYFQEYPAGNKNAGKWFCRFEGTLVQPEYHNVGGSEMKVAGMQTSQIYNVFDTTSQPTNGQPAKITTQAEHIADILNEMRKLGVDTTGINSAAQMEAAAQMLANQKPYFRIRTSVRAARTPQETPGVWENWDGTKGVENYGEQVGDSYALAGATDGTVPQAPAPSTNGHAAPAPAAAPKAAATPAKPAAAAPAPKPAGKPAPAKPATPAKPAAAPAPAPMPTPAAGELDIDQQDTDSLLQLANQKNPAAQRRLAALAVEAGHEQDTVDAAQTWEDVVELINNPAVTEEEQAAAQDEGGGEQQEDDTPFIPEVNQVYAFRPIDKATQQPAAQKVEVKILAVDSNARTVDLQNMEKKTVKYKGISFDSLESAD